MYPKHYLNYMGHRKYSLNLEARLFCLQTYFAKINKLVLPTTAVASVSQQCTQVCETTYPSQVLLPLPCTRSSIEITVKMLRGRSIHFHVTFN